MSGICGIIYFDKKPISDELTNMTHALRHRGLDGINIWQQENVGLAYLKLKTSKNDTENGLIGIENKLVIVADARLDVPLSSNWEALYQKYGKEILYHLVGDFAFVIWDAQQQKLICGRDHAACRPLYYVYEPQKYFAFASEIKALLALPFVSDEINQEKINRYLDWGSAQRPYRSETFYKKIKSLPPAHILVVDKDKATLKLCWDLNLGRFSHLKSDDDYVQAFKETFIEAVRCRTLSDFCISAHLSGGLDSSSICAVASKTLGRNIHTLHFDVGLSADEKMYAEEILKMGGFKHEYVKARPKLIESVAEMSRIFDRPDHFTVIPNFHLANAEAVQKNGSRTLLTGHDGDSVVGFGRAYPLTLFKEQQWGEFRKAMESYAKVADLSDGWPDWNRWSVSKRYQLLLEFYVKPEIISQIKQKKYTNALKIWGESTWNVGYESRGILEAIYQKMTKNKKSVVQKMVFPLETDYGFGEEMNEKAADILHEGMYEATEQFEQIAAAYGHECVHPFYDKRLVELCMAIPDKLKFDGGFRRGPLRRAMMGILPETVRLRTSKVHFDDVISDEIRANTVELNMILENKKSKIDNAHLLQKIAFAQSWLADTTNPKPIHALRIFYWALWK